MITLVIQLNYLGESIQQIISLIKFTKKMEQKYSVNSEFLSPKRHHTKRINQQVYNSFGMQHLLFGGCKSPKYQLASKASNFGQPIQIPKKRSKFHDQNNILDCMASPPRKFNQKSEFTKDYNINRDRKDQSEFSKATANLKEQQGSQNIDLCLANLHTQYKQKNKNCKKPDQNFKQSSDWKISKGIANKSDSTYFKYEQKKIASQFTNRDLNLENHLQINEFHRKRKYSEKQSEKVRSDRQFNIQQKQTYGRHDKFMAQSFLNRNQKYPSFIGKHKHLESKSKQNYWNFSFLRNKQQTQRKEDFIFVKKIGAGTEGQFFLAIQKKSGFVCGIKKVLKTRVQTQKQRQQFINQVKFQITMDSPFITKLYGVFDDLTAIYLLIEYMPDGSLFNKLQQQRTIKDQCQIISIIWQVCRGVSYLHSKGIMHRDIKPQNILVSGDSVKLGDFGSATGGNQIRRTMAGCLAYISPEQAIHRTYDKAVDMWCIGILTFELFFGRVPYEKQIVRMVHQKENVKFKKIDFQKQLRQGDSQVQISMQARQFIEGLLQEKSTDRMTIKEALQHRFLKSLMEEQQRNMAFLKQGK